VFFGNLFLFGAQFLEHRLHVIDAGIGHIFLLGIEAIVELLGIGKLLAFDHFVNVQFEVFHFGFQQVHAFLMLEAQVLKLGLLFLAELQHLYHGHGSVFRSEPVFELGVIGR